jgi:hypothetical protein
MKWIDDNTLVFNDMTIINFDKDGNVEMFPGKDWKKPKKPAPDPAGKPRKRQEISWQFHFQDRDQAISVFNEIGMMSVEK